MRAEALCRRDRQVRPSAAGDHQRHSRLLEDRGRKDGVRERSARPGEMADEVVSLFAEQAGPRGSTSLPMSRRRRRGKSKGDPVRVRRVLANLVNNALKFTEHGPRLAHRRAGAERSRRGCGSTYGHGHRHPARTSSTSMFSAVQQADQSTTRRFGGTGLGLTICQAAGRRHGRRVSRRKPVTERARCFAFCRSR